MFQETDGFVVAGDDVFAVNDFTLDDILVPKIQEDWIPTVGAKNHANAWRRNLAKTGIVCHREGLGTYNWTTHLPHHYEWDKLFAVYDKYDCDHNSYVIENLYYNTYKPKGEPRRLHRDDRWKFEVSFTPIDRTGLYGALASKVWVTCTENGWCEEMEAILADHYGIEF